MGVMDRHRKSVALATAFSGALGVLVLTSCQVGMGNGAHLEATNFCSEPIAFAVGESQTSFDPTSGTDLLPTIEIGMSGLQRNALSDPIPEVAYLWVVRPGAVTMGMPSSIVLADLDTSLSGGETVYLLPVEGSLCP
jgi:hypothetical protein